MEKAAAEKYNTNTVEKYNTHIAEKYKANTAEIYKTFATEKYNTNMAAKHNKNTTKKYNKNTAEIYNQNTTQYFRSCCGIKLKTKPIKVQCDMVSKIIFIPCKNSTEIIGGKDINNPLGILQCSVWARVDELRGERWGFCRDGH